jgi:hypothetical protein
MGFATDSDYVRRYCISERGNVNYMNEGEAVLWNAVEYLPVCSGSAYSSRLSSAARTPRTFNRISARPFRSPQRSVSARSAK